MSGSAPRGPQTLAQKLVARAAGSGQATAGEIVICKVDLAMMHDSGGPRRVAPMLQELGASVWDPDRVVLVTDHYVPAEDAESRRIIRITQDWAQSTGVRNFYDEQGICHVVLPERGHLLPGSFVVGGDSHSCTGGAFGCYMFGIGATEMAGVLVTGEIWLKVPRTIRIDWDGRLSAGVGAKDMMLFLCGRLGMAGGQYEAVEYGGAAVGALGMQERMTLSNMTAELGGQTGLIAPDQVTADWLQAVGVPRERIDLTTWHGDPDADYLARHDFDAGQLSPQVAAPGSPANAAGVDEFAGQAVNIAYIGACTGAKLDDLRMAAQVLAGRKVAAGVSLMVAPASRRDEATAREEGTLGLLLSAGAKLLPNACNVCAGYGADRFDADAVVISSTARNFKGRMGHPDARVYLGSPWTVAASAVTGRITDPRRLLVEGRPA